MSSYQLRKDIDSLKRKVEDIQEDTLQFVPFKEDSPLKSISTNVDGEDMGTIDEILKKYSSGIIDKAYPVGSVYMNVEDVDPSMMFGGDWELVGTISISGETTTETNVWKRVE